jgi:hypothetical protein
MARNGVGEVELGDRNIGFRNLRRLLIALRADWREFGVALQAVDPLRAAPAVPRLRDLLHVPAERAHPELRGLAQVIRAIRLAGGESQEMFAYRNELDRGLAVTVERGRRNVGFTMLRRFVKALGLSWVQFGAALDAVDPLLDD